MTNISPLVTSSEQLKVKFKKKGFHLSFERWNPFVELVYSKIQYQYSIN